MGIFYAFPIMIAAAVLQAVFIPQLDLIGVGPNLIFVIVVAWALNAPLPQGVVWAVVGGIASDLMSAMPLGTSALGLAMVVFVMNALGTQFYQLGILVLLLMGLFGTFFYEFYRLAMLDFFHLVGYIPADAPFVITWGSDIPTVIAPVMLYNVAMILPVYVLLRRLQRRLPETE
ncbi:MAG: rod shape-determining protein MreD [Anaerolineae bacterium]|nr:rod shape-determining protein MreD [Anaerolineae bacterium]